MGGRRPREVDMPAFEALRAQGLSLRACAKILGVPRSTLMSRVAGIRGGPSDEGKTPEKGVAGERSFDDHPADGAPAADRTKKEG